MASSRWEITAPSSPVGRQGERQTRVRGALVVLSALALACGPGAPRSDDPPPAAESAGGEENAPRDPRALDQATSYRDLVSAIRRLDELGDTEREAGCLLRAAAGEMAPTGVELRADLGVAVRPPPDPPASLLSVVEAGRRGVRVLTRWGAQGQLGADSPGVVLVALTMGARDDAAEVLWVGESELRRGALAPERAPLRGSAGPFHWDALAHLRAALAAGGARQVYIVAAAGLPVRRLLALAEGLPVGVGAVLTVPLPGDTRLPAAAEGPAANEERSGLCEAPLEGGEGQPRMDALRSVLGGFASAAQGCVRRARTDTRWGGEFRVMFRLDADGGVDQACASVDELGDPALRACVLTELRQLRLPNGAADIAGGTAVLELPLRFTPAPVMQHLRCE